MARGPLTTTVGLRSTAWPCAPLSQQRRLGCCAPADHKLSFTLTANGEWVDSGIDMSYTGSNVSYTGGRSSYVWLAKLTFTVPPGNDALLVVVDT